MTLFPRIWMRATIIIGLEAIFRTNPVPPDQVQCNRLINRKSWSIFFSLSQTT